MGLLNDGAGCPCGCDRSRALVDQLRQQGGTAAADRIGFSLATISERERAGFITEAMVQHRLRLRALEVELNQPTASLPPPSTGTTEWSLDRFDDVSLRTKLIVHGDTVEVVDGKAKPLKACFLLQIELQNLTDEPLRFAPPLVEASVPLPVSRWYLAGTAGAPWNGELPPRTIRRANVIGYSGAPIAPGTMVEAQVRLESYALAARAVARRRWNEPSSR